MDDYVSTMLELFEIDGPGVTVDFYQVNEIPCEGPVIGCAQDSTVYSLFAPHEHELVHAVRASKNHSYHFFEEGAAVFWGDESRPYPTRGDVLEAMVSEQPWRSGWLYGVAGRFHAFFLERHGLGAVNELLRRTNWSSSFEQASDAIEVVTGVPLEQVIQDFEEYPGCSHAVYRHPWHACQHAREVEWCSEGRAVHVVESIDCDDPETLGPRNGEIWKYVTINLPPTRPSFPNPELGDVSSFWLSVAPDEYAEGGRIEVKHCRGGCGSPFWTIPVPTSLTPGSEYLSEPGRHVLRLVRPANSPGKVSFFITNEHCR